MRTEILTENLLDLADAAAALQVGGRRPHISSLWRWARRGLNGCRLEYARVGRRIVTSREALARFAAALAEADGRPSEPRPTTTSSTPRTRSPAERERAIAQARRELAEAGV